MDGRVAMVQLAGVLVLKIGLPMYPEWILGLRKIAKALVDAPISTDMSPLRLEFCALPPGWGPRILPEPAAFFGSNPCLRVLLRFEVSESGPSTSLRIGSGVPRSRLCEIRATRPEFDA
jgi:hypothetical protein